MPDRAAEPASPLSPFSLRLAALCGLVLLAGIAKLPAIDEESYLWIGQQIAAPPGPPGWPYGWSRDWPPWDGDAFVYAHPPLFLWWMGLWAEAGLPLAAERMAAGLPWALLFGGAAGALMVRTTRHASNAAALWLTAPVVMLGLQNSLMIDLPFAALCTAAVAAWREGFVMERRGPFLLAGIALGAACSTKYPGLLLVPLLAVHGWRRAQFQRAEVAGMARLGLAIGVGIWLSVEAGLWAAEGRVHLWEVWARRNEIPAGELLPRLSGVLVRMGLLAMPLVFLRGEAALLGLGAIPAVALLAATRPVLSGHRDGLVLVILGTLGGALLLRAGAAALSTHARRRKGDRDDGLLLGGWLLVGAAGVMFFHNFASARYLLPVALPTAILVARTAEEFSSGKRIAQATAAIQLVIGAALCVADARFVAAQAEVAEGVLAEAAAAGAEPGLFEGEWSFRWRMEQAGWRHRRPGEAIPPGGWLAISAESAGARGDRAGLLPRRAVDSADRFPLRVVDPGAGIGLYAETLGPFPFGLGRGPLAEASIFVAPAADEAAAPPVVPPVVPSAP